MTNIKIYIQGPLLIQPFVISFQWKVESDASAFHIYGYLVLLAITSDQAMASVFLQNLIFRMTSTGSITL